MSAPVLEWPSAWCARCGDVRSVNKRGCMACQSTTVRPMTARQVRTLVEKTRRLCGDRRAVRSAESADRGRVSKRSTPHYVGSRVAMWYAVFARVSLEGAAETFGVSRGAVSERWREQFPGQAAYLGARAANHVRATGCSNAEAAELFGRKHTYAVTRALKRGLR